MNKTLAALAFAAAGVVAVPAAAQSMTGTQANPNHDGWFVNGQVGSAHLDQGPYSGHDTGYQLSGGYRWALSDDALLGIEGGYNDLGNIKASKTFRSGDVKDYSRGKLRGWMLGANGHFNINPNWYVSARGGLYQWDGHGVSNNENPLNRSPSELDWYAGVGFGYDFNNDFSLGLDYDYYHAKKHDVNLTQDMISVAGEYRF